MVNVSVPSRILQPDFGTTNTRLSAEEDKRIGQFILDANAAIKELTALVNKCETAISPHKRLSEDVLRYIFTLSCEDNAVTVPPTIRDEFVSDSLFALCRVCSAWRKILLDMPSLWSKILILGCYYQRCEIRDSTDNLCLNWLARAGNHPLTIYINYPRTLIVSNKSCEFILDLLQRPNLHSLKLNFYSRPHEGFRSLILPSCLQQLEVFTLFGQDSHKSISFRPGVALPHLTSFMTNMHWKVDQLKPVLPLENLRRLELSGTATVLEWLKLLRQCHALEYCLIGLQGEDFPHPDALAQVEPVEMRSLLGLYVRIRGNERSILQLSERLVLPALEYLGVSGNCHYNPLNVIAQLSQGTPKLKEVFLGYSWNYCGLEPLLRAIPFLRVITFDPVDERVYGGTLGALKGLASGELGPCLEMLVLVGLDEDQTDRVVDTLSGREQCTKALNKEITPTILLEDDRHNPLFLSRDPSAYDYLEWI